MTSTVQSYMSEFNRHVNLYQKQRTEGVENLLNRSLSLLNGSQNLEEFRPESLECCQFYISLYEILRRLDFQSGSDLGPQCLAVLQKVTRNLDVRQALLHQYRFVPLLAKLLEEATNKEIIVRLLTIIQDLSYGIQITWQEPYLTGLIQKLVEYIYDDEMSLGCLALSVLINICYKNLPVIYLLLRIAPASTFSKKIQPYGILAYKMRIIINDYVDSPDVSDIENFIKKSFIDISECFQTCNVPYLKHIVDFLTDARNNRAMQMIFKDYNDSNADIENLLAKINSKTITQNAPCGDDNEKNLAECYALIFVLLESFLKADSTLSEVIPKIFDLAVKWVESAHSSAKALELMRTVVMKVHNDHVQVIIKAFEIVLPNMLYKIEKNNLSSEQMIALFNLLIILLRNKKFQTVVISTFTETYFDKMFSSLLNTNPESLNYAKFSNDDLAKFILCLQVLIEFSNIAPNAWLSKVSLLFETKQIHYVIAKGVLCGNENLCQVVFEMAKTLNFPRDDVAKITSKLSPLLTARRSTSNCNSNRYSNGTIGNEKIWINKGLEEKLDRLVTHIFEANDRSEYNNVATSELIELFHYKIDLCTNTERNLVKNLEDASEEITNLSHRINLLAHEMSQYYSMNFKLHLTQERLQSENLDYFKQLKQLKESSSELVKRIDSERKKYQSYLVSLESKKVQIEELNKEIEVFRKKEIITNAELKKYETDKRDATARIEQLKKSIHLLEETNKEKNKIVETREKELQKSMKTLEELRESIIKSENLIKNLEKQLSEKNDKIRSYEAELLETEEMRKTILSLMESKRPKRAS